MQSCGSVRPFRLGAPWRWTRLAFRVARLWRQGDRRTPQLLCHSYDAAAAGYDDTWTDGMRQYTLRMLERLDVSPAARCLDLTCGTGFVTGWLHGRAGVRAVGVDVSADMLAVARRNYPACEFVHADVLEYLCAAPRQSVDVITIAWGLGYSRPRQVIREMARVLHPGGLVGIIDNSLSSLREMIWASARTFALRPQSLQCVLRVRFLRNSAALRRHLRRAGLTPLWHEDGQHTFTVSTGERAIARLRATGAAAGFELAAAPADAHRIFTWFAQDLERRWGGSIPITHRYHAAVAAKRGTC